MFTFSVFLLSFIKEKTNENITAWGKAVSFVWSIMLVNAVTKFHYVNEKKADDFNVLENFNVSSIKTANVIILIQLSSW